MTFVLWVVRQFMFVESRHFGTSSGVTISWLMNMGPIRFPETSLTDQPPEGRRFEMNRGASPKSRTDCEVRYLRLLSAVLWWCSCLYPWRGRHYDLSKRLQPLTKRHSFTAQLTWIYGMGSGSSCQGRKYRQVLFTHDVVMFGNLKTSWCLVDGRAIAGTWTAVRQAHFSWQYCCISGLGIRHFCVRVCVCVRARVFCVSFGASLFVIFFSDDYLTR